MSKNKLYFVKKILRYATVKFEKDKLLYILAASIIKYLLVSFVDILCCNLGVRLTIVISLGTIMIDYCALYMALMIITYSRKKIIKWNRES